MVQLGTKIVLLAILCEIVVGQNNDFVFPEQSFRRGGESSLAKSLKMAQRINEMETVDEFLELVHGPPNVRRTFFLGSRIDGTSERANSIKAVPAKCMPELQPVPLKDASNSGVIYYPSCTRVKRCGGCCTHTLLSCQPNATEIKNLEVFTAKLDPDGNLVYSGKVIVPVEEHTACKCKCTTKEEHCTNKQIYLPDECRCTCKNTDEEEKCSSNNMKYWDESSCSCQCRSVEECNTGFYFDQNTCRCREVALAKNWFSSTRKTSYRASQTQQPQIVPPVIVPLDASDPRRKHKEDPEYK